MRIIVFFLVLLTSLAAHAIQFELPIDCEVGRECFIQKYVDTDTADAYSDYSCGTLTSPGHQGTDFRLRTLAAMQDGVNVIAAADGVVAALRDSEKDISRKENSDYDDKRGCGNVVILDHGQGWQSHYCHMKQGSIIVKKGDRVKTGQKIGAVGLSGNTEFPHVHFATVYQGKSIDPFTARSMQSGCSVITPEHSLWSVQAREKLRYTTGIILATGIATQKPDKITARKGRLNSNTVNNSPQKIFLWADVMAPMSGDRMEFTFTPPHQKERSTNMIFSAPKALAFNYAGFNRTSFNHDDNGWPAGNYSGKITLSRKIDGVTRIIAQETMKFTVQ